MNFNFWKSFPLHNLCTLKFPISLFLRRSFVVPIQMLQFVLFTPYNLLDIGGLYYLEDEFLQDCTVILIFCIPACHFVCKCEESFDIFFLCIVWLNVKSVSWRNYLFAGFGGAMCESLISICQLLTLIRKRSFQCTS